MHIQDLKPGPRAVWRHAIYLRRPLSSWMILAVNLKQLLAGNVCVDLSRCNVGMAEHHLYRPQISAALQQMAGKRMSKGVRCNFFLYAGFQDIFAQQFPESLARNGFASARYEKIGAHVRFEQ